MTLTQPSKGATATTVSEATVNAITSDDFAYWGGAVFIPAALTTGDTVEFRFYMWNDNTGQLESLYYKEVVGSTSYLETAVYFPPVQTKRYRLTFKRTAGTDRTFDWQITRQDG
jgi:hypothetical protein